MKSSRPHRTSIARMRRKIINLTEQAESKANHRAVTLVASTLTQMPHQSGAVQSRHPDLTNQKNQLPSMRETSSNKTSKKTKEHQCCLSQLAPPLQCSAGS